MKATHCENYNQDQPDKKGIQTESTLRKIRHPPQWYWCLASKRLLLTKDEQNTLWLTEDLSSCADQKALDWGKSNFISYLYNSLKFTKTSWQLVKWLLFLLLFRKRKKKKEMSFVILAI